MLIYSGVTIIVEQSLNQAQRTSRIVAAIDHSLMKCIAHSVFYIVVGVYQLYQITNDLLRNIRSVHITSVNNNSNY